MMIESGRIIGLLIAPMKLDNRIGPGSMRKEVVKFRVTERFHAS
jgi:hypothetical protein